MKHARTAALAVVLLLVVTLLLSGCALFNRGASGGSSTTAGISTGSSGAPTTEAPSSTTASTTTTTTPPTTAASTTTEASTTTSPPTTAKPSTTTTVKPGRLYTILPTKEKVVALTFDAAYDPAPLKGILAALKDADADATFFLTGEFARDFPSYVKLIIAGGYPIGNHSYSHPDFTTLSDDAMRGQIEKTATALEKLGAPDTKPLFRPPYGAYNKRVLSVLAGEGYIGVYWTIDTLDWETDRTTAQIKNAVLKNLKPGAIILMHVGSKQEDEVLPEILTEIKARGYRFVNLRDALPEAGG